MGFESEQQLDPGVPLSWYSNLQKGLEGGSPVLQRKERGYQEKGGEEHRQDVIFGDDQACPYPLRIQVQTALQN